LLNTAAADIEANATNPPFTSANVGTAINNPNSAYAEDLSMGLNTAT